MFSVNKDLATKVCLLLPFNKSLANVVYQLLFATFCSVFPDNDTTELECSAYHNGKDHLSVFVDDLNVDVENMRLWVKSK